MKIVPFGLSCQRANAPLKTIFDSSIRSFVSVTMFASASMSMSSSQNGITKRIFCYGDSLTAGTSPPLFELFPYATHLEKSLKLSSSNIDWKVNWFGLPGWTASSMVDNLNGNEGLNCHLKRMETKPDLAIILCGTNDIAYQPPSDTDPTKIFKSIIKLHEMAHELEIPTLAVSIPPSGWQTRSDHAKNLASDINDCLNEYCMSSENKAIFIPFPISSFGKYDDGDDVWAPDGLHFSPRGYQVLGEGLANPVQKILDC